MEPPTPIRAVVEADHRGELCSLAKKQAIVETKAAQRMIAEATVSTSSAILRLEEAIRLLRFANETKQQA